MVSGSDDKTVRVWNLLEKRQEAVLEGHTSEVSSVAITSDNRFVVSGSSDKTVRVWNLLDQNTKSMIITTNHIFIEAFVSKLENKVYISNGYGIYILKPDENKIYHEFYFDKDLEEFCNNYYCCEEDLMPKIT